MATIKELVQTITPQQVNEWWNSVEQTEVPERVLNMTDKYFLKLGDKKLPFKWAIQEISKKYGFDLSEFNSNTNNRDTICMAYDFEIDEELNYNKTELKIFGDYYDAKIKHKELFRKFIEYGHTIVMENEINPYKIRTAISSTQDIMLLLGMKAVLTYREQNNKPEIGLIVSKEIQFSNQYKLSRDAYEYKGTFNNYFLTFQAESWEDIPREILEDNAKTIRQEYEVFRSSKKSIWNEEANTTNSVIKFLVFKNENSDIILDGQSKNDKIDIVTDFKNWLISEQDHLSDHSETFYIEAVKQYLTSLGNSADPFDFGRNNFLFLKQNAEAYRIRLNGLLKTGISWFQSYLREKLERNFWALGFQTTKPGATLEKFKENNYWDALHYDEDDERSFVIKAFKDFAEIKLNDYIIIKGFGGESDLRVHYIGCVISKDESLKTLNFKQLKRPLYSGKAPKGSGAGNWFSTIINVKRPEDIKLLFNEVPLIDDDSDISSHSSQLNNLQMNTNPLNQILYGPPGTGKTYNTINKALEILGFDMNNKTRAEIKLEFEKSVSRGQIVFTTFHQSMSYEDFIEGIKPGTKDSKIRFHIQNGTFKKLSNRAFYSILKDSRIIQTTNDKVTFDSLHSDFIKSIAEFKGKDNSIFETLYKREIKLIDIKGSSIVVKFKWQDTKNEIPATQPFSVSKDKLKQLFEAGIKPDEVKSIKEAFSPYFKHNLSVYFAVYKKFYDFVKAESNIQEIEVEIDDDLSFEDMMEEWELIEPTEKIELLKNAKKYILIIDEINRGNVSQIFGELITLIEDDKRVSREESIEVILPYSKKIFGVPPNVYIIGTMNTADRSVEALDIALRRRFEFTEMPSQPSLIARDGKSKSTNGIVESVDMVAMLTSINLRIEKLLDRDHQIGHAFFMDVLSKKELTNVFQNKVIPLLQEYFYGDFGKIGLVLGESFIDIEKDKVDFAQFQAYESDLKNDYQNKPIFKFRDPGSWDFESIYL